MRRAEDLHDWNSLIWGAEHFLNLPQTGMTVIPLAPAVGNDAERVLPPAQAAHLTALVRKVQLANLETWRAIDGGADEAVRYDPAAMAELRTLGYLD